MTSKPKPPPKIAPCPFCGKSNTHLMVSNGILGDRETSAMVECRNNDCYATGPARASGHAAIKIWNKRRQ